MSLQLTILVGVLSGLISGYAIYFLGVVFRRVIIPWYLDLTHKGINISGTWLLKSGAYDRRDITLELKQKAGNITGISTHVLREGTTNIDGERIRTYKIAGSLNDRFVNLNGSPIETSRIGALSFLLEVIGDGTTMSGVGIGYSSSLKLIDSRPFVARRIGNTAQLPSRT